MFFSVTCISTRQFPAESHTVAPHFTQLHLPVKSQRTRWDDVGRRWRGRQGWRDDGRLVFGLGHRGHPASRPHTGQRHLVDGHPVLDHGGVERSLRRCPASTPSSLGGGRVAVTAGLLLDDEGATCAPVDHRVETVFAIDGTSHGLNLIFVEIRRRRIRSSLRRDERAAGGSQRCPTVASVRRQRAMLLWVRSHREPEGGSGCRRRRPNVAITTCCRYRSTHAGFQAATERSPSTAHLGIS